LKGRRLNEAKAEPDRLQNQKPLYPKKENKMKKEEMTAILVEAGKEIPAKAKELTKLFDSLKDHEKADAIASLQQKAFESMNEDELALCSGYREYGASCELTSEICQACKEDEPDTFAFCFYKSQQKVAAKAEKKAKASGGNGGKRITTYNDFDALIKAIEAGPEDKPIAYVDKLLALGGTRKGIIEAKQAALGNGSFKNKSQLTNHIKLREARGWVFSKDKASDRVQLTGYVKPGASVVTNDAPVENANADTAAATDAVAAA